MRRLVDAALVVLCAGSVYQLAVAAKLLDLGREPGDGPPLDRLFFVVPVVICLVGGLALVLAALGGADASLGRYPLFPALPVAAAAFPLCHALAFDPYFLPTLERFRGVGLGWAIALAVAAASVALLSLRRPGRAPVALTGAVLVASGVLAVGLGLH
jgi:hypothetical protein